MPVFSHVRSPLVGYYLVGVVLLGVGQLVLSFVPGLPPWLLPATTLLIALLAGGVFMRRVPRIYERIEAQLTELGDGRRTPEDSLTFVDERDEVGTGWNLLAGHVLGLRSLEEIERSVELALQTEEGWGESGVLDSLPESVAVTDTDLVVVSGNKSLPFILGLSDDADVVGVSLAEVLPLDVGDNRLIFERNTAEPFRPVAFTLARGAELSDGVLHLSRTPQQDDEGGVVQQVWTIRDVTQQKLAEAARDDFVSTATHELRTPLTNMRSACELIMHEDLSEDEYHEMLNTMHSEVLRLSRFVDELLDVSKMEAGGLGIQKSETDLTRVLQDVVGKIESQAAEKSINVVARIPAKLPKLDIDKEKITAALVNLLGNAVKYTPEGGEVRFVVSREGQTLSVAVEDTGIGISEEELPKVFEKFYRSTDGRVRDISGSGLGLAFTREIVRRHGGEVTVQSELDKGSVFTMTIPVPEGVLA